MTAPLPPHPDPDHPDPDHPAWLDDFSIPDGAAGAVLALDFGGDGIWAARLNPDLTLAQTVTEPRITPSVLDVRTAAFLRDGESIPGAADPATFPELVDICRRARDTLIERDSVLLMGADRLRMVSVSLDALRAATVPEVNRTHGMIAELAGRQPVAAVFLGPGTDSWPGLWESLSERGFTLLLPGDDFPAMFAGDEGITTAFDAVAPEPESLAWAEVPAPEIPAGPARNTKRPKVIMAVAALSIIAVAGVGVATATLMDDDELPPPPAATTDQAAVPTGESPGESSGGDTPEVASPSELRAARETMKRYTPPPSPTSEATTATRTTEAPLGPRPRPRERRPDTRRTLPNPIPGLPPIVIG